MKKIIISLFLIFVLTSCFWNKQEEEKQEVKTQNNIKQEIKIQDKTENEQLADSERVRKNMENISKKVASGELTEKEATQKMMDSINETTMSLVEKQKQQMPKMLKIMKANLACIKKTNGKSDAKKCYNEGKKLAEELDIKEMFEDENEDFNWDDDKKKKSIEELTKSIDEFEKMMPCITKATNIQELMKCDLGNKK